MRLFLFLLIILLLLPSMAYSAFEPKKRVIELTEFTTLNVDIVPDLGTRFVFPFILDETSDYVPFTSKMTNPVFVSTREKNRNFFVVELPPQPSGGEMQTYLGNLFINVAGYNITVILRSTSKLKEHYTDIVFKLTPKNRQNLIEKQVKDRVKIIEQKYLSKEKELDAKAYDIAMKKIGNLIVSGGEVNNISEDKEFELLNDSYFILNIKKFYRYNDFSIFTYEMEYESDTEKSISITDIQIFGKTKEGNEELIPSLFSMKKRILSDRSAKGNITTNQDNLDEYIGYQVNVVTSQGNIKLSW